MSRLTETLNQQRALASSTILGKRYAADMERFRRDQINTAKQPSLKAGGMVGLANHLQELASAAEYRC